MSNPSLAEIIKDYRNKAAQFTAVADMLERDYAITGNGSSVSAALAVLEKPSLEKIKDFINEKGAARAGTLATVLKTSKEAINEVIDANAAMFERADKGWIKLKQK